ncbi:hypothetical protein ACHAXS_001852 [Conticribra weissflogii]
MIFYLNFDLTRRVIIYTISFEFRILHRG